MSVSLIASSLAYQLGPPAVRPAHRAAQSAVVMEYKLNNYMLPGPMQPLSNQVRLCPDNPAPSAGVTRALTRLGRS